jgi:hypothetical protein
MQSFLPRGVLAALINGKEISICLGIRERRLDGSFSVSCVLFGRVKSIREKKQGFYLCGLELICEVFPAKKERSAQIAWYVRFFLWASKGKESVHVDLVF